MSPATVLEPGRVVTLSYDCTPRGCDDSGVIDGYWTGEIDGWGKYTIIVLDSPDPIYLFDDEIVDVWEPDSTPVLIPEVKSLVRVL